MLGLSPWWITLEREQDKAPHNRHSYRKSIYLLKNKNKKVQSECHLAGSAVMYLEARSAGTCDRHNFLSFLFFFFWVRTDLSFTMTRSRGLCLGKSTKPIYGKWLNGKPQIATMLKHGLHWPGQGRLDGAKSSSTRLRQNPILPPFVPRAPISSSYI